MGRFENEKTSVKCGLGRFEAKNPPSGAPGGGNPPPRLALDFPGAAWGPQLDRSDLSRPSFFFVTRQGVSLRAAPRAALRLEPAPRLPQGESQGKSRRFFTLPYARGSFGQLTRGGLGSQFGILTALSRVGT